MSLSAVNAYVTDAVKKRYAFWVAQWNSSCSYTGQYGLWQYSSKGSVSGINGNVDLDYGYADYPSIIKKGGFNGFTKGTSDETDDGGKDTAAGTQTADALVAVMESWLGYSETNGKHKIIMNISVPAAAGPSLPTGIADGSTVLTNAISVPGSKAVMAMNEEQFERETLYQATMNMFQGMLHQGVITKEQYDVIDTKMLEKYRPLLGGLFSENTCYVSPLE